MIFQVRQIRQIRHGVTGHRVVRREIEGVLLLTTLLPMLLQKTDGNNRLFCCCFMVLYTVYRVLGVDSYTHEQNTHVSYEKLRYPIADDDS